MKKMIYFIITLALITALIIGFMFWNKDRTRFSHLKEVPSSEVTSEYEAAFVGAPGTLVRLPDFDVLLQGEVEPSISEKIRKTYAVNRGVDGGDSMLTSSYYFKILSKEGAEIARISFRMVPYGWGSFAVDGNTYTITPAETGFIIWNGDIEYSRASASERALPQLLKEFHSLVAKDNYSNLYASEIDYEPYLQFLSENEMKAEISAWRDNNLDDGRWFKVFAGDGSGGKIGFWYRDKTKEILNQPVVYLGSEGQISVTAKDFADFLWLFAYGYGPLEISGLQESGISNPVFIEFASAHASSSKREAVEMIADTKVIENDFKKMIENFR